MTGQSPYFMVIYAKDTMLDTKNRDLKECISCSFKYHQRDIFSPDVG